VFFVLYFLYFVLNSIESEWGSFKTTLYVFVSLFWTIGFSLVSGYPVTQVSDFESTLFLAAASLFPETEVSLFFFLPVKMKWLALFSLLFLVVKLVTSSLLGKIYLLSIYSNYFIFFGPALYGQLKQAIRRYQFKNKMRR
jgi:hypothetical protein